MVIRPGRHVYGAAVAALFSVLLRSATAPTLAAEPTAELAAGGIVFAGAPDLVTDKEDVALGASQVRVTYTVRNAGEAARSTLIAFALPNIDMLALDGAAVDNPAFDPKNPANYVAVAVLVDGQPAETYADQRALALGLIDQTARLAQLQLPLYPLTAGLGRSITTLPDAAREDLAANGLIRLNDGQWEPLWRLRTTLFWRQRFEIGQTHTIVISYRPIVSAQDWTPASEAVLRRYCVPPAQIAAISKRGAAVGSLRLRTLNFRAGEGASGRGAAGSYRVSLEVATETQAGFSCFHGLATGGTVSWETAQPGYTPDDDIQVLFVD